MKKLRSIQREFAIGIMRPLTPTMQMKPKWVDGKSTREAVAKFIKPNDRLSSFERLQIYNRQYWFRLLDSFYEDFPGLRTLIGEERFQELSIAYLTKYPSRSYTLRDLGNCLEKFLVREPKWVAPHHELAREIVRLEWAHIVAFVGEAFPPIEIDDLLGSDPATLKLAVQPCITFLACDYAVDNYVIAARRQDEQKGEASNAMSERVKRKSPKKVARPKVGKIWLAVHRSENSVYYKRLEPEAYLLCRALQKGLTLQVACIRALKGTKGSTDLGIKLRDWFAQWASFGWFYRATDFKS